jgi:protein gp37
MNRASSATGWVRNPVMMSPNLDPKQASSYELGWTYNPITGCLNHVNGLCKGGGFPCYAYRLANGRLKQRYLANNYYVIPKLGEPQEIPKADPFYPRFWEERLGEPIEQPTPQNPAKRKGIFPCDMSDLFGLGIPEIWTEQVMTTIKLCPQHRFYLLTKQPQNLIKFSPFPENCWVGVSCPDANALYYAIPWLDEIKASRKFISFEPLLASMWGDCLSLAAQIVHWLIIGAQTKPTKFPEISWVREIVNAADKAGIPVFLKDNLRPLLIPEDCSKPNYLTEDIFWASEKAQLRQELPE